VSPHARRLAPLLIHRSSFEGVDIFISFRFAEAHAEAKALKTALEARQLRVYVAGELPGEVLDEVIFAALDSCRLAILLASESYGCRTNSFSTFNELNFVLDEPKPFYLVKMCERWSEAHVRGKFGSFTMYKEWEPGEPLPDTVVDEIQAKLDSLTPRTGPSLLSPRSSRRQSETSMRRGSETELTIEAPTS